MKSLDGRNASPGFTLIELILASAVLSGMLGAAYLCLQAGFESQRAVESRMDIAQNARVAFALLAVDLRAACPLSGDDEFVGMDRTLGEMEADNIDFATHNWSPEAPGEADLCEVSYFVNRNPETGQVGLWRRRDPSPDREPFAGGRKEEVAVGLRGFRLEYYDGFRWYDTWGDAGRSERTGNRPLSADMTMLGRFNLEGLPDAVRITLAFSEPEAGLPGASSTKSRTSNGESRPQDRLVFQTVVRLNLAGRRKNDVTPGEGSESGAAGTGGR